MNKNKDECPYCGSENLRYHLDIDDYENPPLAEVFCRNCFSWFNIDGPHDYYDFQIRSKKIMRKIVPELFKIQDKIKKDILEEIKRQNLSNKDLEKKLNLLPVDVEGLMLSRWNMKECIIIAKSIGCNLEVNLLRHPENDKE